MRVSCAPKIVVDVLRDARALALDVALALGAFQPAAHPPPRVEPDHAAGRQHRRQPAENTKPRRLPEIRQHFKRQARAGFVPHAVVVARDHLERIISGRNVIVSRHPLGAGVHPIGLEIVQPAFEPHFFRSDEAQAGVFKFNAVPARRNFQRPGGSCRPRIFCRPRAFPRSAPAAAAD